MFDVNNSNILLKEIVDYTGSSISGTNNGGLLNLIDRLENKVHYRKLNSDGTRDLAFEVNGNIRIVTIKDKNAMSQINVTAEKRMADTGNQYEIGANIPGNVYKILVKQGDKVVAGQPIAILEAMKMETNVIAPLAGTVNKIHAKEGTRVVAGELIAELE